MAKIKKVGISPITNRIYYGTQDTVRECWMGNKVDITDDAIKAVFVWFMDHMKKKDEYSITYPGSGYQLSMIRIGESNEIVKETAKELKN